MRGLTFHIGVSNDLVAYSLEGRTGFVFRVTRVEWTSDS
jgi:hypothetical protein